MNAFEKHTKQRKDCVPFLSPKPRPKKKRKHLAVNRQQTPLRAAKVLFTTKTNGHEKLKNINANRIRVKSSRLKSVHWSRSVGRIRRNTFATSLVSSGAELLAAALDRFLVFGIFTNLAIIKDKVIKMFSRNKLLGRSWKRLFLNKKVSHSHENLSVLVTCQTTFVQEN